MRAIITVDMDGAAFVDDEGRELARILQTTADRVNVGEGSVLPERLDLHDINGNTVGELRIVEDAPAFVPGQCGVTLAVYAGHPVLCVGPKGHAEHHNHLAAGFDYDARVPPHRLEDRWAEERPGYDERLCECCHRVGDHNSGDNEDSCDRCSCKEFSYDADAVLDPTGMDEG